MSATPDIPSGVQLEVSGTDINVTWTANTDSTEGYIVRYGLSSSSLLSSVTVHGRSTTTAKIENLKATTLYYVAVAAYIGNTNSSNSEIKSITTGTGPSKPSAPEDFRIQSLGSITETSITLAWKKDESSDLKNYRIYYGTSSGSYLSNVDTDNAGYSAYTVSGLEPNRRYYFAISATNNDSQESDITDEAVADTLPDTLAPPAPEISFAGMSGPDSISIRLRHPVPGLADIKGSKLYWGTSPGVYDNVIDLGTGTGTTITGLSQNVAYYFAASASDVYTNESQKSSERQAVIEDSRTLLSDDKNFSGCFIRSAMSPEKPFMDAWKWLSVLSVIGIFIVPGLLARGFFPVFPFFMDLMQKNIQNKRRKSLCVFAVLFFSASGMLLTYGNANAVEGDNTVAVKWGYFIPSEKLQEDIYDNGSGPVSLLYERRIYGNLVADIEAGYMWKSGYAVTVSGEKTGVKTELEVIPVSIGLQYEYEIMPYVVMSGGIGGELWHVSEDPAHNVYRANDDMVPGWFARACMKFFTQSEMFEGYGVIIESKYSSVDRFGSNETDLGGIMLNAGLFYRF